MHSNGGCVVSNFIVQAFKGEEIALYDNVQQGCGFCYVIDLTEVFIRIVDLPK